MKHISTVRRRTAAPRDSKAGKDTPASGMRPRTPRQERGRARYEALLDAAEALLAEAEIAEIGFYEIVKRAGMPAASAYHFFPAKSAIFMALAERYFAHFIARAARGPSRAHPRWQDFLGEEHDAAVAYYNSHKGAMKLILGAQPFLELQLADSAANSAVSAQMLERFRAAYAVPPVEGIDNKFLIAVAIADGIWRASFTRFGRIVPSYADEARRALVAYFRTFLPEHLGLRRDAAAASAPKSVSGTARANRARPRRKGVRNP